MITHIALEDHVTDELVIPPETLRIVVAAMAPMLGELFDEFKGRLPGDSTVADMADWLVRSHYGIQRNLTALLLRVPRDEHHQLPQALCAAAAIGIARVTIENTPLETLTEIFFDAVTPHSKILRERSANRNVVKVDFKRGAK